VLKRDAADDAIAAATYHRQEEGDEHAREQDASNLHGDKAFIYD
jgi:hypothetical protein